LTMFTDLLFHLGPYGVFYGKAELNETKNDANYFIPYHPRGKLTLLYGYEFPFGLKTEASMNYASESFVDISNTQSLPAYFDLGLKFSYKIVQDFNFTVKLSNLLGDDIYYWNGYKEPPLDLIAGFKYMW
jgi:outer membrane receptor for monomeric catechols